MTLDMHMSPPQLHTVNDGVGIAVLEDMVRFSKVQRPHLPLSDEKSPSDGGFFFGIQCWFGITSPGSGIVLFPRMDFMEESAAKELEVGHDLSVFQGTLRLYTINRVLSSALNDQLRRSKKKVRNSSAHRNIPISSSNDVAYKIRFRFR